MFDINQRIAAFVQLGAFFKEAAKAQPSYNHLNNTFLEKLENAKLRSKAENGWFTPENINYAISAWGDLLTPENLKNWLQPYRFAGSSPKKVAIIMAGNIPLVGFHDFLSVLLSGHIAVVKMSSEDKRLLPVIADILVELNPDFAGYIFFEERIKSPEAVIATGSNNSARYFDYYFAKYPHIIRKNRTSVALITGEESQEEMRLLGKDIFQYFGLGCRNVSKIYMPNDFDINRIFAGLVDYADVNQNHKYGNNYDYHRAIYMLNMQPFLENGFVLFRENRGLHTPVSVVHYERYSDLSEIKNQLKNHQEEIQCVVGQGNGHIPFGQTQAPQLWDYADGVDTLMFLQGL